MTWLLARLLEFPGQPIAQDASRAAIWERVFPNHRPIFMTRRNKVRPVVSWVQRFRQKRQSDWGNKGW